MDENVLIVAISFTVLASILATVYFCLIKCGSKVVNVAPAADPPQPNSARSSNPDLLDHPSAASASKIQNIRSPSVFLGFFRPVSLVSSLCQFQLERAISWSDTRT